MKNRINVLKVSSGYVNVIDFFDGDDEIACYHYGFDVDEAVDVEGFEGWGRVVRMPQDTDEDNVYFAI